MKPDMQAVCDAINLHAISREKWEMLMVSKALLNLLEDPFNIGIAKHMARKFLIRSAQENGN